MPKKSRPITATTQNLLDFRDVCCQSLKWSQAKCLAQNISELFYFLLLAFMAFMNDLMCYRAILMRHATSLPSPVASAANAPEVESKAWQSGTWAVVAFELQKSLGTQFWSTPTCCMLLQSIMQDVHKSLHKKLACRLSHSQHLVAPSHSLPSVLFLLKSPCHCRDTPHSFSILCEENHPTGATRNGFSMKQQVPPSWSVSRHSCLPQLACRLGCTWVKTACLKMGMGPQPIAFLISVSVNLWIGKMNVNQQFLGFPTIFRYKKAHRWSQPSSCSKGLFERPACFQHVLTDSSQEWLKESQQTWVYSINSKIKDPTVVNYSTCSTFEKTLPLYTLFETQASGAAALCCFILCAKLHKAACCWSLPRLLSKSSRLPLKQLL